MELVTGLLHSAQLEGPARPFDVLMRDRVLVVALVRGCCISCHASQLFDSSALIGSYRSSKSSILPLHFSNRRQSTAMEDSSRPFVRLALGASHQGAWSCTGPWPTPDQTRPDHAGSRNKRLSTSTALLCFDYVFIATSATAVVSFYMTLTILLPPVNWAAVTFPHIGTSTHI